MKEYRKKEILQDRVKKANEQEIEQIWQGLNLDLKRKIILTSARGFLSDDEVHRMLTEAGETKHLE